MTVTGIRAPRWLKPVNRVYMVALRRGINVGKEHPVVLTVPGRTSGKPRSTPITPMQIDGHRYVVAVFPGADWVRNVRAADAATLTDGRHTEHVRMVELSPEQARPLLRAFPAQVPAGVGFLKKVGLVTDGRPEELEALAGRLPVFRFDSIN